MSEDCMKEYDRYMRKATQLRGLRSRGSAAQPAGEGSGPHARQQAEQLKTQEFSKHLKESGANEGMFMRFVRYPNLLTPEGIPELVEAIEEMKQSKEYAEACKEAGLGAR